MASVYQVNLPFWQPRTILSPTVEKPGLTLALTQTAGTGTVFSLASITQGWTLTQTAGSGAVNAPAYGFSGPLSLTNSTGTVFSLSLLTNKPAALTQTSGTGTIAGSLTWTQTSAPTLSQTAGGGAVNNLGTLTVNTALAQSSGTGTAIGALGPQNTPAALTQTAGTGTLHPFTTLTASLTLTQAYGTAAVGNVSYGGNLNLSLTGVTGTGAAGQAIVSTTSTVALTQSYGSGATGLLSPANACTLAIVSAYGNLGTVTFSSGTGNISVNLSNVYAVGGAGTLVPWNNQGITQVSGAATINGGLTGYLNSPSLIGINVLTKTGLVAQDHTGDRSFGLTGVQSQGVAGLLNQLPLGVRGSSTGFPSYPRLISVNQTALMNWANELVAALERQARITNG